MIYTGHRGCLAGQIVLQGYVLGRPCGGSDYVLKTKSKGSLKSSEQQAPYRLTTATYIQTTE